MPTIRRETGVRETGKACLTLPRKRLRILHANQPNEDVEMKSIVRAAFIVSLMGSAAGLAVLAPSPVWAEQKLSQKIGKPLQAATKAAQAGDYAGALASIKEAQAIDDRTDFENYKINAILAYVAIQMKDFATATTATEAAADSPAMPDEEKPEMLHNAVLLAVPAQQYQKAIVYGQQLQAINGLDPMTEAMLARAYYELKDFPHAQQYAQMSVDASKAAGKPPSEVAMQIILSAQANQHNEAGAKETLENLAVTYNKPDTWGELINAALGGKNVKDADALYLLRLKMLIPDAMKAEDYTALASVADQQSYSTEALDVLQKGIARGKITSAQAGSTYSHARSGAALDARELPSIASSAEKSKNGLQDIKLAEDYWGYGRFADAEAVARRAIAKGGLKDPSEGPLLLGMLLVVEGKYADAIQTLSQVSGTSSRTNVAHLWSLYAQAQQKSQGTTATAPAH
jgi:hypothetical protein